ncbi:MAG: hypothetical protein HY773_02950 [Candidatus Terrybacteria bacterium]|nr:hypothetical protein [Candidatus Terrybacteria bacterium]
MTFLENIKIVEKKLPARVYYVFSPEDDTVLLALDIRISGDTISWFDTVKERIMHISQIQAEDSDRLILKTPEQEGGKVYVFTPLTLEIYKDKVKKRILVPQEFKNKEEMLQAFEKTRENAW